jgi:hypothetical protein
MNSVGESITTTARYKNEISVIILITVHITLETRDTIDKTVE